MSQTDLAHAVGTSQTCIHNWENDNTYPRPANMVALATALGVTQRFLEEGEGGCFNGHDCGRGAELCKSRIGPRPPYYG
ncbi:helix-turn-helix transcriptional regulator [Rhizobium sp. SEMIA 4085]|nr:helix-turn-helix transcriptional regulator [Rhizobium sp. SEMIA 4085]